MIAPSTKTPDFDWAQLEKQFSPAQINSVVVATRRKLALWYGAVSSGKTIISLLAFLIAVKFAPKQGLIVVVGRTLQTIYQNVFVNLQNAEIYGSLTKHVRYTPGAKFAYVLGREVMVIGASNKESVGRIQGATIGLAYVDEAALLPEVFWNMLISRLRVPGARLLATMNPASKNHWIRKSWILKAEQKNLVSFHFTMRDNPGLPEGYVEDMEASFSGIFFDRMIKGEWTNAEGSVYPMWNPDEHTLEWDQLPELQDLVGYGMDYGTTNATTALLLGVTAEEKPKLILVDEWGYDSKADENHGVRLTDGELSTQFRKWAFQTQHLPYPSSLKPRFIMLDPAAASFHQQLYKDLLGTGLAPWAADNSVNAGIATIGNLLETGKLLVTDRCKGWLSEVTEYQWDEKATEKGDDQVLKENDHYLDGGRYIVQSTKNIWEPELLAAA